jgi:outer membrane usher protein
MDRFMPWFRSFAGNKPLATLALALALGFTTKCIGASEGVRALQLEVFVNDNPTNLIGSFTLLEGRRISARQAELEELGLKPQGRASPDELIVLDDLPGLTYRYEEQEQRISITTSDELRIRKSYDASGRSEEPIPVRVDYGGVLNYTLFAASTAQLTPGVFAFNGASATLDGRLFTPFGTFSQSAIVRTPLDNSLVPLRLDTAFTYSNPETLMTYRGGDTITGGLAWTRPIRIGGLQVQRNFGLRPDLVTVPLPVVTGSAAVASTVDVYVNNLKTFSQEVSPGPFKITNIPVISGNGAASIVLRDSAGREVATSLPFYASPHLLAQGISDFSLEGGVPRLSYGTVSDSYIDQPVIAASLRRGIFDWLTIESHLETDTRLINGGAGAVLRTGSIGVVSWAVAASFNGGNTGFQSYVSYDTKILDLTLQVSSQRTFDLYDDLASVTARIQPTGRQAILGGVFAYSTPFSSIGINSSPLWTSARPPKALNRISIGVPSPFDSSSLSASFIQLYDASGIRSDIVTGSWSRGLPFGASVFATAFSDFGHLKKTGFFVGASIPLGGSVTATSSASRATDGNNLSFDVAKPLEEKPGSVGWRLAGSGGNASAGSAAGSYRSSYGRADAAISHDRNGTSVSAQVEGAIATMGNGVFLAGRIDDSFAVVETGVPGIEVFHENRSVAVTDSHGRALIPGLRSYQKNKLAIDTRNLPVDAEIATTQDVVAPADRSGVRVNFAVRTNIRPAILVLMGPDGTPLPIGSRGTSEGGENFVVGYDGRAYVKNLNPENTVIVTLADSECRASFSYSPRPNEQTIICPVTCRSAVPPKIETTRCETCVAARTGGDRRAFSRKRNALSLRLTSESFRGSLTSESLRGSLTSD